MDKKLQDLAWPLLPKEFKEKVKKLYLYYSRMAKDQYDCGIADCIETIFGKHNLTSDAEGEEMLMVSRRHIQYCYQYHKAKSEAKLSAKQKAHYKGRAEELLDLFGSKCLPDEEPKPAEPKFKVGDIASYVCSPTLKHKCTITEAIKNEHSGKWEYNVMFEWGKPGKWIPESDLEPYTEPEEPTCTDTCTDDSPSQSRNLSQETANCDKCNDLRLHIAAMVMQGIMSASDPLMFSEKGCLSAEAIARQALKYADALIAESEKGGRNEKA